MTFLKTKGQVGNRGVAPDAFLIKLIQWGRQAPRDIFETRGDPKPPDLDIYTKLKNHDDGKPFMGPWRGERHRIAFMLEVLRVLAGRESSWKWGMGRDTQNPTETTPETKSAGIFQVSYNSRHFGKDLQNLLEQHGIALRGDGDKFQEMMKNEANSDLIFEYTARLLRHTHRHHGPVRRREIDPYLSVEAIAEFEAHLS